MYSCIIIIIEFISFFHCVPYTLYSVIPSVLNFLILLWYQTQVSSSNSFFPFILSICQKLLSFIFFLSSSHMELVLENRPTTVHTHTSKPAIDPTQDPSSVYYLHPSNFASIKLVSIVFDGTCFSD